VARCFCSWCYLTAAVRSFPQGGQIGRGLPTTVRYRGVNITILASHRWQICSTPEGSWTLSSVAA
jgi:hypothetical protein